MDREVDGGIETLCLDLPAVITYVSIELLQRLACSRRKHLEACLLDKKKNVIVGLLGHILKQIGF